MANNCKFLRERVISHHLSLPVRFSSSQPLNVIEKIHVGFFNDQNY